MDKSDYQLRQEAEIQKSLVESIDAFFKENNIKGGVSLVEGVITLYFPVDFCLSDLTPLINRHLLPPAESYKDLVKERPREIGRLEFREYPDGQWRTREWTYKGRTILIKTKSGSGMKSHCLVDGEEVFTFKFRFGIVSDVLGEMVKKIDAWDAGTWLPLKLTKNYSNGINDQ